MVEEEAEVVTLHRGQHPRRHHLTWQSGMGAAVSFMLNVINAATERRGGEVASCWRPQLKMMDKFKLNFTTFT